MIRVLPGPDGRHILANWSDIGGLELRWRDNGDLIQHRIYSMLEMVECLSGTLPEAVHEEVREHEAELQRIERERHGRNS